MKVGAGGWEKTKNASCREQGGEKSELWRASKTPGVRRFYMREWLPGPWIASYGLRERTRRAKLFPHHRRGYIGGNDP